MFLIFFATLLCTLTSSESLFMIFNKQKTKLKKLEAFVVAEFDVLEKQHSIFHFMQLGSIYLSCVCTHLCLETTIFSFFFSFSFVFENPSLAQLPPDQNSRFTSEEMPRNQSSSKLSLTCQKCRTNHYLL